MKSEHILKCLGNVNDCYIDEVAGTESKNIPRGRQNYRKILPAACLTVCILFTSSIAIAKTMGLNIRNLFSTEQESGYNIEFKIEKVSNDVFTGKVNEVHAIIAKQHEDYSPLMSWSPSSYYRSFESVDQAVKYLGVDFIDNPVTEKADEIELRIEGNQNGEFEHVSIAADYEIDNFRVQTDASIYSDKSQYAASITGKSVIDGAAFDQGIHSIPEIDQEIDSVYTGVRAAEYETYTSTRYSTQSGIETLILQSSPNENGFVSLDGYFVKGKVFYFIHVVATEDCTNAGMELLKNLLEKY